MFFVSAFHSDYIYYFTSVVGTDLAKLPDEDSKEMDEFLKASQEANNEEQDKNSGRESMADGTVSDSQAPALVPDAPI